MLTVDLTTHCHIRQNSLVPHVMMSTKSGFNVLDKIFLTDLKILQFIIFFTGYDNSHRARELIQCIASTIRQKLNNILSSANAFSVLSDGSQARKTGSEKELVLVRVLRHGAPIFYCAALQDIDSFGDANADNLKKSIDDTFTNASKLGLPAAEFKEKFVSATVDGAAVNTGVYNGLLTQLKKDDRPWLVNVHCVSHRVELAIKDALLKNQNFVSVQDFLTTLYYLFKKSGKFARHFHATATALDVQVYRFKKVHGTRFVNHQRQGLANLLHNWIVLAQAIENSLENTKNKSEDAKLQGILKKLRDYSFLAVCCLYKQVLDAISMMSFKFEKGNLLPFEIMPSVAQTVDAIQDIIVEQVDIEQLGSSCGFNFNPDNNNEIQCLLPKPGHLKRKYANREHTSVSYQGMKNINSASTTVNSLKSSTLQAAQHCLKQRFSAFDSEIYKHMLWLDPANWVEVEEDVKSLVYLSSHFEVTLSHNGKFNGSEAKLKREWKDLRLVIKHYYNGVKASILWEKIFQYRRKEFPNVCLLAEIVFCIGVSNSSVEKGFSHLTCMLSDRRLNLKHSTMEDLLMIKINNLVWNPTEREELMEASLENFMETRRKQAT